MVVFLLIIILNVQQKVEHYHLAFETCSLSIRKEKEEKKNQMKNLWILPSFASKIIYERCHRCIYTIKQCKEFIDHCYLPIYKMNSCHHFLNVIHNEAQQRSYASQKPPHCNEISMNVMIFKFSLISSHCHFLTKKK